MSVPRKGKYAMILTKIDQPLKEFYGSLDDKQREMIDEHVNHGNHNRHRRAWWRNH